MGDYWRILEITGDYWRITGENWELLQLEISGGYWDKEKLFGTAGDHERLLEDTGGLPEITGGFWGLLENSGGYWRLLEDTGDYWILVRLLAINRLVTFKCNCLPKLSPIMLPPNSLIHSHTHFEAQNLLTKQYPLNTSTDFHKAWRKREQRTYKWWLSQVHIDYQLHTCVRWITYLVCLSEHQSSTLGEVSGNQAILGSPSAQNSNLTASLY